MRAPVSSMKPLTSTCALLHAERRPSPKRAPHPSRAPPHVAIRRGARRTTRASRMRPTRSRCIPTPKGLALELPHVRSRQLDSTRARSSSSRGRGVAALASRVALQVSSSYVINTSIIRTSKSTALRHEPDDRAEFEARACDLVAWTTVAVSSGTLTAVRRRTRTAVDAALGTQRRHPKPRAGPARGFLFRQSPPTRGSGPCSRTRRAGRHALLLRVPRDRR